jgi:hypothetical protein
VLMLAERRGALPRPVAGDPDPDPAPPPAVPA